MRPGPIFYPCGFARLVKMPVMGARRNAVFKQICKSNVDPVEVIGGCTMNRIVLSVMMVALLSWANVSEGKNVGGHGCCPPPACCEQVCCQTRCCTTYQTVVQCVPVTRYRMVRCVDECGCCRRVCVPYTTYVRQRCRVPVTTCCTQCCAAPAHPCAANACCEKAPRRAGLLARVRAARANSTACCN